MRVPTSQNVHLINIKICMRLLTYREQMAKKNGKDLCQRFIEPVTAKVIT